MELTSKQKIIKEHKEDFTAALNAYLDKMYQLTDSYLEDNERKEFLTPDEKVENFVKELIEDEKKYEDVRRKILDNDFNLSVIEIQYAALAMAYCIIRFDKHIEEVEIAKKNAIELYKQIETQEIPNIKIN